MQVLASPGQRVEEIPGHESSDHVLRLVGAVFRMSEVGSDDVYYTRLCCTVLFRW